MGKEVQELKVAPEQKLVDVVEQACKVARSWNMGEPVLVGYEIHMVVGHTLQSLKFWAQGFDINDYEQ